MTGEERKKLKLLIDLKLRERLEIPNRDPWPSPDEYRRRRRERSLREYCRRGGHNLAMIDWLRNNPTRHPEPEQLKRGRENAKEGRR